MSWLDWSIVGVFLVFIIGMGIYSMRFVHGVTDFLACGRVCGRYVISVSGVADGLALITMVGAVEAGYKSGFAYSFWGTLTMPITLFLSLLGFVYYRFRQTKAMSFGQFIEMRYSRRLRIFASTLRSIAEMLANMILPALAGRFFISFLNLPESFSLFGLQISTFMVVMFFCLGLAITMILLGGSVTMVITDTIQGLIAYPLLALFVGFVLLKVSWNTEVLPVLMDRVPHESFLNPYDVQNLRDFNVFYVGVILFRSILNRGVGLGAGGASSAARSPHEQKMAGVLGTWRGGFMSIFFLILVLLTIVFMNHRNFAKEATECRRELSAQAIRSIVKDPQLRAKVIQRTDAIPQHNHRIGVDAPLSVKKNLDTPYLEAVEKLALEDPASGLSKKVPEFKTLYHQLMLPVMLRKRLPTGLLGLFCMLVILMIISTDNGNIYSASLTLSQDLVLPLLKIAPSPRLHINIIRLVTIGVGVFFFIGSCFMSQLEYVNMFTMIMYGIWTAGAGVVVLGGLYTRFGTTAGAWSALLSGSGLMVIGILIQRNWSSFIYPWLEKMDLTQSVAAFLKTVSAPLNPYVVWEVTPFRCPVNAVELSLITMLLSIVFYCVVSLLTFRKPFNLDRMLHRGKYNTDGNVEVQKIWTWKNFFSKAIGITNEYTRGDRIIAWSVFIYSFGWIFGLFFLIVTCNLFYTWPSHWWGNFYLIRYLLVSMVLAVITTVWFFIGGTRDLRRMFRDLRARQSDDLDNGLVSGNVSLCDQKKFEEIEKEKK